MSKPINILIVDDSAFMRLLIGDILSKDPDLLIVGTASDGKEAVEQAKELNPDVILMDLVMGEYDGLYATKEIMAFKPIPILILSSVGNSNLEPVFEALRLGAVDYINKPNRNNAKMRLMEEELIHTIRQVAKKAKPRRIQHQEPTSQSKLSTKNHAKANCDVVVIGASTGGPSALEQVIRSLPENLSVPVIIVQHMPANFIEPFVHRLDSLTPLKVVSGNENMLPVRGMIVIASGNTNLCFVKDKSTGKIVLGNDPKTYKEYNHPSINSLFLSTAEFFREKAIAVLMTGMGKDGVVGLKAIKEAGGTTIVQDQETSVIFGMPKAAIAEGAAMHVLPLYQIGNQIVRLIK
ncbi:MAG: two-component system chemotaxis response regulator CheB [Cyclobacteriaceae bacterium]|jgi:two-component system chemotaxis response regulator CheB